jgi:hypothetical protein
MLQGSRRSSARPSHIRSCGLLRGVALCCLVGAPLVGQGCENRQIRVEMAMDGDGVSRAFASNTLAKADVDRLKSIYASDPEQDQATGGQRFVGTFGSADDNALPSEVGNRNGTSEINSRLGVTRFYFETFAQRSDEWASMKRRIDAGELWVRLFGRWAERGIRDGSKREAWQRYVDGTLVPLSTELAVMWGANAASAQALRVAQQVRRDDDRRPMTDEERLLARTSMPMLLAIADAGLVTDEEAHRLLLIASDANATKAEREWVINQVGKPALLRLVQRFRPETKSLKNVGWTSLALNFWIWAQTSPERNDLLLASPVISDGDKDLLRSDGIMASSRVTIPPPFGIDPLDAPTKTDAEVRLATGERPFLTNGEWIEESREVRFKYGFVEADRRTTLSPPYYYAAWSVPDVAVQTKLFGRILLSGQALADYGIWYESLPLQHQIRWNEVLDRLGDGVAGGEVGSLARALRMEIQADHPLPKELAEWFDGSRG